MVLAKKNIIDAVEPLCKNNLWSKKGNHLNTKGYSVLTDLILNDYLVRKNSL